MTARRSEKIFPDAKTDDPDSQTTTPRGGTTRRVLSVSPNLEVGDMPLDHANKSEPLNTSGVFMTPRVIDQAVFDELSSSLRSLVDEAGGAAKKLQSLVEQAMDGDQWANKASVHLQERLRLSARMLKAFQAQIARVEQSIEDMQGQEKTLESARGSMDESLEEFENHLGEMLAKFEKRLDKMTDRAIGRFGRHLEERHDEVLQIETRTNEAQKRVECSIEMVEEVEESVLRLAHRTAENATRIEARTAEAKSAINRDAAKLEEKARFETEKLTHGAGEMMTQLQEDLAELKGLILQSGEASRRLTTDISQAEKGLEEAGVRCRGIRCALEAKLDQCREVDRSFQTRFEEITTLVTSLDVDAKTYESLHTLLDRLTPWQNLLLRDDGPHEGLPESLATMLEDLRDGIGKDMSDLSRTMKDMASRIDDTGVTGRMTATEVEVKPDAETTVKVNMKKVRKTISAVSRSKPGGVTIETKSSRVGKTLKSH